MDKYDYREQAGMEESGTEGLQDDECNLQDKRMQENQILSGDDILSRWKLRSDKTVHRCEDIDHIADAPECGRADCYNCIDGSCVALNDNDFGHRECPFFIRTEQAIKNQRASLERLIDEGREDLLKKYGAQLAALDIVELGDTELEQMFASLRAVERELMEKGGGKGSAFDEMTDEEIQSHDPEENSTLLKKQTDAFFGGRSKGHGLKGVGLKGCGLEGRALKGCGPEMRGLKGRGAKEVGSDG